VALGLPRSEETRLREWYDSFEHALANFAGDPDVQQAAHKNVAEFHAWIDEEIAKVRAGAINDRLLGLLVRGELRHRLQDDEIRRNLLIIFFGAISTVEALILNMIWALAHHRRALTAVQADQALIGNVIEETLRWLGPVQSATRHVLNDIVIDGVELRAGEVVNCMLGAANHDPAIFPEPAKFDFLRKNAAHHLGFATGNHLCLGFRLAKAEARIALEALLHRFPAMEIDAGKTQAPQGFEFRQSKQLVLVG
jgi:cytochrome P450